MRLFVFLLILLNLLFFAFGQGYFGHAENPDSVRLQQQINADKIKLLASGEPPRNRPETPPATPDAIPDATAANKPAPESPPSAPAASAPSPVPAVPAPVQAGKAESATGKPDAAAALALLQNADKTAAPATATLQCLSWSTSDKERAESLKRALLKQFSPQSIAMSASGGDGQRWWVYLPPFATAGAAEFQIGRLKDAGVQDVSLINEGPNRLAISLGLFSSEDGAKQRQQELQGKGVRNSQVAVRGKPGQYVIEARVPEARAAELRGLAGKLLPEDARSRNCR